MARVFLDQDETFNAASNDLEIFGTAGAEQVTIFDGVTGVEAAGSVERVDLPGDIGDFTFSSFGNSVTIRDGNGDVVATVSDAGGKQIVFGDGALDAAFDTDTGEFTLGGVATSTGDNAPAAITPAPDAIDTDTTSDSPGAGTGDDGTGDDGTGDDGTGDDGTGDDGTGDEPVGEPGDTFTLTDGVDLEADFTGGPDNDTFIADDSGASAVVGPADELFGGDGNDTLRIFESQGTLPGTVDSIETVQLNLTPDNTDLDLSGLTDTTAIELVQDGGTNSYTIGNDQDVTIRNTTIDSTATALELNYSTDRTAAAVALDGVSSAGTAAEFELDGDSLTSATLTAENNDSTVDALNTGGSANLTTLTIDGDAALEITDALDDAISTVDASGNSGGVDVVVGNVDTTAGSGLSVTGSSAADTLDVSGGGATTLNTAGAILTVEAGEGDDTVNVGNLLGTVDTDATFTISGGDDEDTLVVTATFANEVEASDLADFETLELAGTGSYDLEGFGFNSVVVSNDLTANTLTIDDGVSVELTAGQADLTIDQVGAGAAGSLDDSLDLTLNPDGSATQTQLTADNIETINLTSTDQADDPSAETNTITNFDADGLGTLNISGDANLTFTNALTDPVDLVQAGGFSGDLTLDVSGQTNAASVTSGSGDDTLTGSGRSDVIDAGAGEDLVNVDADAAGTTDTVTVNVTTGAGADEVDHSTTQGLLRSVIDDFSFGNDELGSDDDDFDGSGLSTDGDILTFVQTAVDAGAVAADIEVLKQGTLTDSAVFEFDGATHVVGSTNQDFDADGDVFISLQGVTGLETSDVPDLFA